MRTLWTIIIIVLVIAAAVWIISTMTGRNDGVRNSVGGAIDEAGDTARDIGEETKDAAKDVGESAREAVE